MKTSLHHRLTGFSLVEVLAAVTVIGIIAFLALPNIVTVKADSEQNLAIARAEAVNMAISSFIHAHGHAAAATNWTNAANNQAKYSLLAPYLAYAPTQLADYMPSGFGVAMPASIASLAKVPLSGPSGAVNY